MTSSKKQAPKPGVEPEVPEDAVETDSGATYRQDDPNSAREAKEDGFDILKNQHRKLRECVRETAYIQNTEQAEGLQIKLADCWREHEILHQVLFEKACHAGLQDYPPLADAEILADLVSFLLDTHVPYEKHIDTARLRIAGHLVDKLLNEEELPEKGLIDKMKASGVDSGTVGEFFLNHMNVPATEPLRTDLKLRHLAMRRTDEHKEAISSFQNASDQTDKAGQDGDDPAAAQPSGNSGAEGDIHVTKRAQYEKLSDAGLLKSQHDKSARYSRRCRGRGGWWDDTDPDLLPTEKPKAEF